MKLTAGIDVGSTTSEAAIYDPVSRRILGTAERPTGWRPRDAGWEVFGEAMAVAGAGRSDIGWIVGTGYGRVAMDFADQSVTEITCHARGAGFLRPEARTVIDIGGQDSKIIGLDSLGRVRDFAMNDRCAAGTGRFLEAIARVLETPLEMLGEVSLRATEPVAISSTCAVFAESEVIGLLAQGVAKEEIIAGIHLAIATRMLALAGRIVPRPEVVFCGGVAYNAGMKDALERALRFPVFVPESPEMVGAIGAALTAASSFGRKRRPARNS